MFPWNPVPQGYHGVIVGWDRTCCEDDAWRSLAQVDRLARRENQPFYHVLVDQVSHSAASGCYATRIVLHAVRLYLLYCGFVDLVPRHGRDRLS